MLTKQDELLLKSKGIKFADFEKQLADFKTGFPFLRLESAATIGNGIVRLNEDAIKTVTEAWNNYKAEKHKVVKFVPASGAASRMFKNLFAFLDASSRDAYNRFREVLFR